VEDNGIGFDQKYAEDIFGMFKRLHHETEFSGTGIGLALCKKIVEQHNGAITALSTMNAGSKFIVSLPLP
jgi:light-regulated signal transduction histidine kinase (bacteriophytochrome)